jgi:hypothetical protein
LTEATIAPVLRFMTCTSNGAPVVPSRHPMTMSVPGPGPSARPVGSQLPSLYIRKPAMLASADESWRDNLEAICTRCRAAGGCGGPDVMLADRPGLPVGT